MDKTPSELMELDDVLDYLDRRPDAWAMAAARILRAQSAEVTRLREDLHYANGCADLAMKHRDEAEAENKLLRGIIDDAWRELMCATAWDEDRLSRILARASTRQQALQDLADNDAELID